MRAIDSPHEITPKNIILREKFEKFSIFASIHTSISLNQGQGSIFTLRECAQSIFRMILGLYRLFWQKKFRLRLVPKCYPSFKNSCLFYKLFITYRRMEKTNDFIHYKCIYC